MVATPEAAASILAALKEAAAAEAAGEGAGDLAGRAYRRLQYDFPKPSVAEARALREAVGAAVEAGTVGEAVPLTQKFVENIAALAHGKEGGAAGELRGHFQAICGLVFVTHMAGHFRRSEQQRAAALGAYRVPPRAEAGAEPSAPPPEAALAAEAADLSLEVDAAVMDDDDEPYEALAPPQAPEAATSGDGAGPDLAGPLEKAYHLVSHLDSLCLTAPEVWRALKLQRRTQDVLRALVDLAAEARGDLHLVEEMVFKYTDLLVKSFVVCRETLADVADLQPLRTGRACPSLEGRSSLSFFAALASQGGAMDRPARTHLWRALHEEMGFINLWLMHLHAQLKGKERSPAGHRDWSNDLFQTCAVVDFYVTQAPAGPGPARALTQTGVLKSLVLLFGEVGTVALCEPLRCSLLFVAALDPSLAAYAARVPSFKELLAGERFAAGGPLEIHGAMWRLVLRAEVPEALLGPLRAYSNAEVGKVVLILRLLQSAYRAARRAFWPAALAEALEALQATLRGLQREDPHTKEPPDPQDKAFQLRPACLQILKELLGREVEGKRD